MTEPLVPPSPTAEDVRAIMRSQNWKVGLLAAVLLLAMLVSTLFVLDGRAASENSAEASRTSAVAVRAALANNARAACITNRRNEQLAAIGEMIAALGLAQDAGFFSDDEALLEQYRQDFLAAAERQRQAAAAVVPEVLDSAEPEGCGPPITDSSQIPPAGGANP